MTRRTGVWLIAGLVVTAGAIGVGLAVGRGQAAPETRCIDTWNNPHSGGQALDGLYSPSLTAFSGGEELGFVSRRASVVADHWDCSIRFEVGGGWTYTFADVRDNESPVIVGWSGSGSPQPP